MSENALAVRSLAQMVKAGLPVKLEAAPSIAKEIITFTKRVGGPMATALDRLASVLTRIEQSQEELSIAAAGPKASARLITALPVLVLLGAGISGLPVFRVMIANPIVLGSCLVGLLLFWLGSRLTTRILRGANPETRDPGASFELLAIAVDAGMPLSLACIEAGVGLGEISFIENGIASGALLRDKADELRMVQWNVDRKAIQKASVKILWPLGLTVLPAFVLVAIVPIGLTLLAN